MEYMTGYVVFGALFLIGLVGYWVVTQALRDPSRIYLHSVAREAGESRSSSSP